MKDKFLVRIPNDPDDIEKGYLEIKFKTYREISSYLGTGLATVRAIVDGTVKFAFDKTKRFQGIKIERLKPPKTEEETKQYYKDLLEKALHINRSTSPTHKIIN